MALRTLAQRFFYLLFYLIRSEPGLQLFIIYFSLL